MLELTGEVAQGQKHLGPPGKQFSHSTGARVRRLTPARSAAWNMFQSRAVDDRTRRIVDTAIELAEKGGFEAVRLRDVAAQAGVALGTLYRRFRSKEELLLAAL